METRGDHKKKKILGKRMEKQWYYQAPRTHRRASGEKKTLFIVKKNFTLIEYKRRDTMRADFLKRKCLPSLRQRPRAGGSYRPIEWRRKKKKDAVRANLRPGIKSLESEANGNESEKVTCREE